MSILKKEENMTKSGVTFPLKQMIAYEWCMKVGIVLNPLYTKETTARRTRNVRPHEKITQWIQKKLLVGVVNKIEKGVNRPKKGLVEIN
jgi:hypothetical protein